MATTFTARAALLDMDGTLVDSTAVVEHLWLEWAEPHGLDRETVLRTVHGRQGWQSMAILLPERDHEINLIENQRMLARESAETDGVVAIRGADDLLRALDGLPHAIVTSANVALMTARMGAAGLAIPELAVTAERVTNSKPDPEGFLLAASLLGIAPADCVVFEDSGAGIRAGLDAGMTVVGVGPHAPSFGPAHHVDDLTRVEIVPAADGFEVRIG
ncbi:HAD-IA family hydrolase [Microbacterium sp. YMB-B2]|uniref:HAD-IA family hydrolase n=1 Tax=Microbacterium tenebrionis TaxID=2830665 RepID=A0A9X1S0S2_9MICO|nr:HAD-IA family hydrolase [Microbacterium tenebrionis]MCC2029535.1 HAD-IA family hydrolase [Microbacterium tenebrionis]